MQVVRTKDFSALRSLDLSNGGEDTVTDILLQVATLIWAHEAKWKVEFFHHVIHVILFHLLSVQGSGH